MEPATIQLLDGPIDVQAEQLYNIDSMTVSWRRSK
jgi:hypothetical protein